MAVLREIEVDGAVTLSQILDFSATRCRGMVVHVSSNIQDQLIIRSGLAGVDYTHLVCQPFGAAANSIQQSFGGPIVGDAVQIDWQGSFTTKRAKFLFLSEPVLPFGSCVLGYRSATALGAGNTTAFANINLWGDWPRRLQFWLYATNTAALVVTPTWSTGTTYARDLFLLTATQGWGTAILDGPSSALTVNVRNTSAGAIDCFVVVQALMT